MRPEVVLRRYTAADEGAAIALWQRTWQHAYPDIDFAERLAWWRKRWREELVPSCTIVLAEMNGRPAGFVTVDPESGELDQIVVAPEYWGTSAATQLMAEAKRIAPGSLHLDVNQDNARALAFYRREGFVFAGESINTLSGRPIFRMRWQSQS